MRILFVCTGNTCRSPMAEAIFNSKCDISNDVKALSRGLSIVPKTKASQHSTTLIMESLQVSIGDREAIQLDEDTLKEVDLVLTMTSYIRDVLKYNFKDIESKIFTLNEYVGVEGDVLDPYGGNKAIYKDTYDSLLESINLLIKKIKEDKDIKG
ncbi:low molecular weight protein arginine phosphatase [Clostridium sp.]|uniref:low molecular weight protein arginine phosphatase n=1 Tax=Clostridium sp. TaxID=1506 RepID=UPI0034647E13